MENVLSKEEYEQYRIMCSNGIKIIEAQISNIGDEVRYFEGIDLFNTIKSRVKEYDSLKHKCEKRGTPFTLEGIRTVHDVAGVRVITQFEDYCDIICNELASRPNIEVVEKRDYIKEPKPSGYRSLHLIVHIQVRFMNTTKTIPVEIQIRTEAMEVWASVEHKLRYKPAAVSQHAEEIFQSTSKMIAEFDRGIVELRKEIEQKELEAQRNPV